MEKINDDVAPTVEEAVGSFDGRCCICGTYFEDGICDNGHTAD